MVNQLSVLQKIWYLGVYYLTMQNNLHHKGDGSIFANMDEVELSLFTWIRSKSMQMLE